MAGEDRGAEVFPEFGDIAGGGKPGLFKLILSTLKQRFGVIPKIDNLQNGSSTTAIQKHGSKLYALQETCFPFALNARVETGRLMLDGTGDWDDFNGQLNSPFTAHPKIDPQTGRWYTYSTDLMSGTLRFSVLSDGELSQNVEIAKMDPALSFLHDCYLTKHYSIFPDSSLRFNTRGMMGEHQSPFVFDSEYKLRFGVIKRSQPSADDVQWFTTDLPGHIWHTINAWEEKSEDGSHCS